VVLGFGAALFTGSGIASASDGPESAPSSSNSNSDAGPVSHQFRDVADAVSVSQARPRNRALTRSNVPRPAGSSMSRSVLSTPTALSRPARDLGRRPKHRVEQRNTGPRLAGARRELSFAHSSKPITVTTTVELTEGVVTGSVDGVDSKGLPLTYTVASQPSDGGKVLLNPASGSFSVLPYATTVNSQGTEHFSVLVSETTPFDASLERLPVVGSVMPALLVRLHEAPVVNRVLVPAIGEAVVQSVVADLAAVNPNDIPIAFTVKVISFDGTPISTNYFPASGLETGDTVPTIFYGPGFGRPGNIDPNSNWNPTSGVAPLRQHGYNVVTWDPRGEFSSGGTSHFDSPQYEGRDVSAIIDWVAQQPSAELDSAGDPRIGMIGGSYGGEIQLVTAGMDHRVDAIVPALAWNSLNSSVYKNQAFKSSVSFIVPLTLLSGGKLDPQFYSLIFGVLAGTLRMAQQDLLAVSTPDVGNITAPTLLIQGTVDTIFTLDEASTTAQTLAANGIPVKMIWYCGGHGACLSTSDDGTVIQKNTLAWLDRYVKNDQSVSTGPTFEWIDQNGQYYFSDFLPSDQAFYGVPVVASGTGGNLAIVPIVGGSGPQLLAPFPFSLTSAAKALYALDVTVQAPATTTQIVGAPTLTMTYSGVGTSRHVYAQLVDDKTGLVVGNTVTPIPVTLDGQRHTVTVPLEDVAYTMSPDDSITLQVVGSATQYENLTSVGAIEVSSIELVLPTAADAVPERATGDPVDIDRFGRT